MAESCEYGNIKDKMMRDRLVVGIRDQSLSKRLQMEVNLNLDTAKKLIRQKEAVQQQQELLKGNSATVLETVKQQKKKTMTGKTHKRFVSNQVTTRQPASSQPQTKVCKRCGKGSHPHQLCPARDVTCYRCQLLSLPPAIVAIDKVTTALSVLSRTMGEVVTPAQQTVLDSQEDDDLYSDTIYLDAINNADDK